MRSQRLDDESPSSRNAETTVKAVDDNDDSYARHDLEASIRRLNTLQGRLHPFPTVKEDGYTESSLPLRGDLPSRFPFTHEEGYKRYGQTMGQQSYPVLYRERLLFGASTLWARGQRKTTPLPGKSFHSELRLLWISVGLPLNIKRTN